MQVLDNRKGILVTLLTSALLAGLVCAAPTARAEGEKARRAETPSNAVLLAKVVPSKDDTKAEAAKKAADAAKVFREIMGAPDKGIPKDLLDSAEAVGVFPGILKAGFIFGARGGSGLISRRVPGGWSAPAFFHLGGGDWGAQIGAEKIDLVMLFMNEGAVKSLLSDKFEVGAEASATAGPVGRTASASTTPTAGAGILTYSRTKGLFAGLELKGAVIKPDNDLNMAEYGMKASDILMGNASKMQIPQNVAVFPRTLSSYSRK
jgi:lipid-binding SYLF domain-containing protein